MQSKTLLLLLSVAAFSSCSTAYRAGQTPDDVYYSPVKVVEKRDRVDEKQDDRRNQARYETRGDYEISMCIRDRRWRDFREDYTYKSSPYNYVTCNCSNYGYYYNPYYYPWAIYTPKAVVNTTPRMVNLNAYSGYNTRVAAGKTSGTVTWSNPATQYNNSNRSSNRSEGREVLLPRESSSSNNNTRTYTPSSNNSSSGSGRSSSGSSGSGSVSRPGRGG